ncbi:MAG TPA: 4-alpha-glucanotransferase [Rhizomicrobium sp.]|nr:4-alpha-glucanotransferase [Rhizomicrobium sp.]
MSDDALRKLARAAGLYVEWTDANGRPQEVKPDTLRAALNALGYPTDNDSDIVESQRRLDRESRALPPLIAAVESEAIRVGHAKRARLRIQDGEWHDLPLEPMKVGGSCVRAPKTIGYHELELDGAGHILAVAPPRCFGPGNIAPGRKFAGLSVQIYSLRGGHSSGFGDYAALAEFASEVGTSGIDALSVSPAHARFAADAETISPYAPSTRLFLDPLYADIALAGTEPPHEDSPADLIDWPDAHRRKYAELRAAYERFSQDRTGSQAFLEFCEDGGQRLRDHAIFEALDAHFRRAEKASPREWPEAFRDPRSVDVQAFAEREKKEVRYHLYLQWLAARSAAAAQARAKERMAIGIIADMAVGVDRFGSQAWSAPHELMGRLTVGAPPDAFNLAGQDWGLTNFSPTALRTTGYDGFIATLRASMQYAGGIRIDHAMGLRRLWVLPAGASPAEGVYISYPMHDLLRLIARESWLHRAIVIGEDLGTVPQGFHAQLSAAAILGMRVLWFEWEGDGRFIPPERWDGQAAALTTTHDLPTVAGWWAGRDIEWAAKLRRKSRLGSIGAERRERQKDRALLWTALTESGCARGTEPAPADPDSVIDGALAYVGKSPAALAMASVEDVLALPEQPNLPGTIDEHPNWRRRLPDVSWSDAAVRARLAKLAARRRR